MTWLPPHIGRDRMAQEQAEVARQASLARHPSAGRYRRRRRLAALRHRFWFRSLRYPGLVPDPGDLEAYRRYWEQSDIWWGSWAHNFMLCFVLLGAGLALGLAVILVLALG